MKKRYVRAAAAVLLLALLFTALPGCAPEPEADEEDKDLEIYFFDAGKADAILLMTENTTVLIDCGLDGFGSDIVRFLKARDIFQIDALILTHFDKDHIGGADEVIDNIDVLKIYQSDHPKNSDEYQDLISSVSASGLRAKTVHDEESFTFEGVKYAIDGHKKDEYDKDNSNNSSLIVTVSCKGNTILFMGDAQTERIEEYLSGSPADCDLMKIPHHGGKDKLMGELIEKTSPEYAVITCSDTEPDTEDTRSLLEAAGVRYFMTSEGPVRALCTSGGINIGYR